MPLLTPGLQLAPQEPKATIPQTNNAKVASLERQAQKEQPSAKPATRESLATNPGTPAKSVTLIPFKIKTPNPVHIAKPAPVASPTKSKEPVFVKTKDSKNPPIATKWHTSMTLRSTKTIGIVCRAPSAPPALVTSIGTGSTPNLGGPGVTTTMLPLNVALFQRLVWVEPTPP